MGSGSCSERRNCCCRSSIFPGFARRQSSRFCWSNGQLRITCTGHFWTLIYPSNQFVIRRPFPSSRAAGYNKSLVQTFDPAAGLLPQPAVRVKRRTAMTLSVWLVACREEFVASAFWRCQRLGGTEQGAQVTSLVERSSVTVTGLQSRKVPGDIGTPCHRQSGAPGNAALGHTVVDTSPGGVAEFAPPGRPVPTEECNGQAHPSSTPTLASP